MQYPKPLGTMQWIGKCIHLLLSIICPNNDNQDSGNLLHHYFGRIAFDLKPTNAFWNIERGNGRRQSYLNQFRNLRRL